MSDGELEELTARAEALGYKVVKDRTWGYVLVREGNRANPGTHSNANLEDLREMIDGIEWGASARDR
jgi:hypothetical protein